jgi:hypothetical protein
VTDVQGCQGTDSLITTLNPPIELSISQQGDQLIALASGGQGDLEYLWSNGETQPFITPATSGTFALTVTDENLCTAQATSIF